MTGDQAIRSALAALRLHAAHIDLARVRSLVAEFAAVLETPERAHEFEAIVARATPRGPR